MHPVVLTVEGEGPVSAQESLHYLDCLFEPVHPHPRWVVGDARLLVVGLHPSRAKTHFETALAQHVEGGRLLGQHERVPVVVSEDERPQPQGGRGRRGGGQGGGGCQLVAEVVGHEQGRVAEVLGPPGLRRP
jgi:hypothetical protein